MTVPLTVSALTFKRMSPGQIFLACIKQVRDFDLLLSLPNRLFGTVPCNQISPTLTDLFSRFADGTTLDSASSTEAAPSLTAFYKPGEFVVCVIKCVRETEGGPEGGDEGDKKRIIELSMLPEDVNRDMSTAELVNGLVVVGTVSSRQDRGFVVNCGSRFTQQAFCQFNKCDDNGDGVVVGKTCLFTTLIDATKPSTILQLSAKQNRLSELFLKGDMVVAQRSLLPGNLMDVIVKDVQEHRVVVSCPGGGLTGYLDYVSGFPSGRLQQPFKAGDRIRCRLVWVDPSSESALLSARESVVKMTVRGESEIMAELGKTVSLTCRSVNPKHGVLFASTCNTGDCFGQRSKLFDDQQDLQKVNWKTAFTVNHKTEARQGKVIGFDLFTDMRLVSLQPSVVSAAVISYTDINVGSIVKGTVMKHGDYGLLVRLAEKVKAICPLFHLSDTHSASKKMITKFPVGQSFRFRVLEADPVTKKVTLCRRRALIDSQNPCLTVLQEAKEGQQYDGYVVSVNDKGAIVRFYGKLTALLPVHELVEGGEFVESAKDILRVGQSITVRAKQVDLKTNRFVVTLKSTIDPPKLASNKQQAKRKEPVVVVEEPTENNAAMMVESAQPKTAKKLKAIFEQLNDDDEEEQEIHTTLDVQPSVDNNSQESNKTVSSSQRNKKSVVDEYEKRLMATPNASVVWIEYAAAMVSMGATEAGREVLERALRTISIREQAEKLNCWTALLNIENIYGNASSLRAVFERAVKYTEPKHLFLPLAAIYCHNGKHAEAHELFVEMQRKFKTSCKVWLAAIMFYMTKSRDLAAARRLLPLALKALPARKHVKLTLKAAQLEYKHGEQERARTLFEGLLAAHPKRIDLWLVYVQMEENLVKSHADGSNLDLVRRIYERALTMKLSSKKAKTFFKAYLAFEKECGDAASQEHVKQLARNYVEGKSE